MKFDLFSLLKLENPPSEKVIEEGQLILNNFEDLIEVDDLPEWSKLSSGENYTLNITLIYKRNIRILISISEKNDLTIWKTVGFSCVYNSKNKKEIYSCECSSVEIIIPFIKQLLKDLAFITELEKADKMLDKLGKTNEN